MRKINVLLAAVFCLSLVGLAQADTNGICLKITGYKAGEATISDETKESLSKAVKDLDKRLLSVKDQSKLSLSVEGAADNVGAKNSSLGRERAEGVVTVLKYLFPQAKISVKSSSGSLSPGEVAVLSQLETANVAAAAVAPVKTAATKKETAKTELPKAESASVPVAKQQKRSNSEGPSWLISQWTIPFLFLAGLAVWAIFHIRKIPKSSPAVHDDEEEEVIDLREVAVGTNVLDEIIEPAVMAPKVEAVDTTVNKEEAPALVADDAVETADVEPEVKKGNHGHDSVTVENVVFKIEGEKGLYLIPVEKITDPKNIGVNGKPPKVEYKTPFRAATLAGTDMPIIHTNVNILENFLRLAAKPSNYSKQVDELIGREVITLIPKTSISPEPKSLRLVVGEKADAGGPAVAAQTAVG